MPLHKNQEYFKKVLTFYNVFEMEQFYQLTVFDLIFLRPCSVLVCGENCTIYAVG